MKIYETYLKHNIKKYIVKPIVGVSLVTLLALPLTGCSLFSSKTHNTNARQKATSYPAPYDTGTGKFRR